MWKLLFASVAFLTIIFILFQVSTSDFSDSEFVECRQPYLNVQSCFPSEEFGNVTLNNNSSQTWVTSASYGSLKTGLNREPQTLYTVQNRQDGDCSVTRNETSCGESSHNLRVWLYRSGASTAHSCSELTTMRACLFKSIHISCAWCRPSRRCVARAQGVPRDDSVDRHLCRKHDWCAIESPHVTRPRIYQVRVADATPNDRGRHHQSACGGGGDVFRRSASTHARCVAEVSLPPNRRWLRRSDLHTVG